MKTTRKLDSQIMQILNQAQAGMPVSELCREYGMSTITFYKWRAKYGGMDTAMISGFKELEAENARLKKVCADESLKSMIVQEALTKKAPRLSLRKEMAKQAVNNHQVTVRLACQAFISVQSKAII